MEFLIKLTRSLIPALLLVTLPSISVGGVVTRADLPKKGLHSSTRAQDIASPADRQGELSAPAVVNEVVLPLPRILKSAELLPKSAQPFTRCKPLDPELLNCSVLSAGELQLTGTTLGRAAVTVWDDDNRAQVYEFHITGINLPLKANELVNINITEKPATIITVDSTIAEIRSSTILTSKTATGHEQAKIVLRGHRPGDTSLVVIEKNGRSQNYKIRVRPDLTELQQLITARAPRVTVRYANDYLVLEGFETNDRTIAKIVQLAKAYAVATEEGAGESDKPSSDIKEITTQVSTAKKRSSMDSMVIDKLVQLSQDNPKTTYKIINLIKVDAPQQVLLEVKVAQVDKTALKELGISTLIKGSSGEGFTNLVGAPTGFDKAITSSTDNSLVRQLQGTGITGNAPGLDSILPLGPYQAGFALFKPGIGAVLKALTEKQLAKILAEPNLLVKSGQDGRFLAGQRYPVSVVVGYGAVSTTEINYIDVGVKINFKPEVLDSGLIALAIDPAEVSNITGFLPSNGYPIIDSREVRTSVQLKDGESLVLAGLLQEETIKSMSKIPFAGDIPILGALFRSTKDDVRERELVFFITPRLVTPTPQGVKTTLPTDAPLTPEQEREFRWMPTR